jgi:CelD/BcsL family acetyltransferase involved in cellulose biosynthesis
MATTLHSAEPSAAPSLAPRYSCHTISTVAELQRFESDWPTVERGSISPMTSFNWSLAAAVKLADEQLPRVIVARGEGVSHAVAPLARMRGWGPQRWEMLGLGRLNEPADFVFTDREALSALIARIIKLRRPLFLGRLPAESPTIGEFERACRGKALVWVRPQAPCPFIALDKSWLEPESHLSSKRRSDYRRALRRAEKHGAVHAELLAPRSEEVDPLLDIAFDIEARSWKGAAGTALVQDPLRGGFLRDFAHRASAAGTLRIALLRIGEVAAAMQVAVEEGGRWWLLKIGFDPALAQCSPGVLPLAETLRHATRGGLESYEFLGTVEPWTQVWTEQERQCVSVRVYPFGLGGMAALAGDAARAMVRRLRDRRCQSEPSAECDEGNSNP